MADLGTYWNTIRHLKPVQVYGRLRFQLTSRRVDVSPAPPIRAVAAGAWVPGAERPSTMLGPGTFRFLNETHDLTDHGWDDPKLSKLWRYNLHYFDDLNARGAASRAAWHRELLRRWVRENPPAVGTGWEPYPTSLRIVNCVKWALRGNSLPDECTESLAVQVRWVSRRLETHLLGNHLFANAKALVMAGLYFDGRTADEWFERGMGILAAQIPEQILGDGGQFERSTMYHALALEDMLDLSNALATYSSVIPESWKRTIEEWRAVIGPMRMWLATMSHPDGEISLFNDAAMKIAAAPASLEEYARHLGYPSQRNTGQSIAELSASGYIRVEQGPAIAILDVGPVGPDYLPAHAHADTLSFELSVFGRRVAVNTGTSRYELDAERLRQRGTAAHNTVVINGENSSEVWSGFRVARRARPLALEVARGNEIAVRCSHDGYRRLTGKPVHTREWSLDPAALIVTDSLSGDFQHAQARFHLHPAIVVERIGRRDSDEWVDLVLPEGQSIRFSTSGGTLHQEPTTWHPEFGVAEPNVCLAVDFAGSRVRSEFRWNLTR